MLYYRAPAVLASYWVQETLRSAEGFSSISGPFGLDAGGCIDDCANDAGSFDTGS